VLPPCRFASGTRVAKVVYDIRDQDAGLFSRPGDFLAPWKPPAYAEPDRFVEREVTVGTSPALPGTLTLPKGTGPFPAVVLVHGSGPNDADETLGPNKIFKDLAWGLAQRGIAVLRYVKRSRAAPRTVATVKEEVLDGAHDAIDLLSHTREIDPRRIVVIGHSQGGYLAPRIAAENPTVAGIVLLAAPSRPLEDSILDQLTYFLRLDPGSAEKKALVAAAQAFKTRVEDPALKPDESVEVPGGGAEKGAYFLSLRGYDPVKAAAGLSIPILILQGDRDYQVTAPDFEGWRKALSGRPNVKLEKLPSLNHLFISGSGTPRPGEYEVPGHVDPAVIADIAAFVGKLGAGP
jgi:pimeloyl-ACP methyl ester carboxylesterase